MRKTILSHYLFTFTTEIIVTSLGIIILKIAADNLSEEGLGAFIIVRRLIALLVPIVTINMGISIARFININSNKSSSYFFQSLIFLTLISLLLSLICYLFSEEIAEFMFGNSGLTRLLLPTIIFLYATSFQLLCHSYFRGKHNFNLMNIVNIIYWVIATISLLCLLFDFDFIEFIIYYFVIFSIFSLLINWIIIITDKSFNKTMINDFIGNLNIGKFYSNKRFINYGLSRLPQGFFFAALFFLPIFLATNLFSLKEAAYVGIIVSVIRMLQMVVYPFNLIFLPKFSLFQFDSNNVKIKYYSQIVLDFFFTIPLILGLIVFFISNEVILLWFGEKYEAVVELLMLVSPFTGFFLVYVLIRGILDGLYDYPFSNFITFGGISCTILISILSYILHWELIGLMIAFSIGILFLGVSSIIILVRKQNLKIMNKKNIVSLVWYFILLFLLPIFIELLRYIDLYYLIAIKIISSIIIILISLAIYKIMGYEWVDEVKIRIKQGSTT